MRALMRVALLISSQKPVFSHADAVLGMTRKRRSEREGSGWREKRGVGSWIGEWANVIVVHFTNPDKGWQGEMDQFAILCTVGPANKGRT